MALYGAHQRHSTPAKYQNKKEEEGDDEKEVVSQGPKRQVHKVKK